MIDLLPIFKEMAAYGITPAAAVALAFLFKLSKVANGFDKRLALLEQTTKKCERC